MKKIQNNLWASVYRAGWFSLAFFALVAASVAFVPKVRELSRLKAELTAIEKRTEIRDRSIRDIQYRRDRFAKDPAFIERTARQAGFFRPGEIIVDYVEHPGQ